MRRPSPGRRPAAGRLRAFLLRWIPDVRDREDIAADLEELRARRARSLGPLRAWAGYGWELLRYGWALRFGGIGRRSRRAGRSRGRDARAGRLAESVWQDLRFALRGFVRAPGIGLVALPTIALTVGATTAIFSFLDALVLRPLPVPAPDRLVALWHIGTDGPRSYSTFSYPDFLELREASTQLASLAAFASIEARIGEGLAAEPVEGQIVSGDFFDLLGVEPVLGRGFLPEEDRTPGTHAVVVLGEELWERAFARDPGVLGATVVLAGRPFTVVGVAPRDTPSGDLEAAPDFWVPLMMHAIVMPGFRAFGTELFGNRGTHWLSLLGRLAPGTEQAAAEAELRALAAAQAEASPDTNAGWSIAVARAGDPRDGPPSSRSLVRLAALLVGVVGMVFLIACANVANLLLARASARGQEMGVRTAIGAGRARLVRQLLTEALALAALGGAAGVLLATWLMALLPSRLGLTATLPGLDVRLDGRVLGFGLGLSLLTGALFGVAPALQASAGGAARAGHHSDASSGADRTPRLRALLVSVQVALSLVLLVGAGLMLRTLGNLASVPLGFETAGVRVAQVDVSEPGMPWQGLAPVTEDELGAARLDVYGRILDQIRQLPGAEAASLALVSPFSSMRMANDVLWEAPDSTASLGRTNVDMNVVGDDWFRTMKVPLVLGRPFTDQDRGGAPDVAIVNEALAARLWPGESAVGKRLWSWRPDGPDQPLDVVGVAANGRYYRSWQTADRPFVFLPLAQNPMASMTLHVRGVTPAVPTAESIRAAVLEVAPDVPAPRVHLLSDARAETIGLQRSTARLLGLFGALALTIAAIGIYGVVSFSVSRRTREIGLRVALGARPLDVRRFVIVGGALPVVVGTALGCVIALGLGRFAVGLLYGVGPRDPLTFGSVAALLLGIGLLASYLPARRATRVSPLEALRH